MLQVLRDRILDDMSAILTQWDCGEMATIDRIEINEYGEVEKGLVATPVAYQLASELGRSPADIAVELADAFRDQEPIEGVSVIETAGGYEIGRAHV